MAKQTFKTKVVAALDTETTTIHTDAGARSVPVTFQLLWTEGQNLEACDIENLKCRVFRVQDDLAANLAPIVKDGIKGAYIPVIAIHNLAYDLRFLMSYIQTAYAGGYRVTCCFKSSIKPLTVTISQGRTPRLIFWDTLTFSGMGLARMGRACGWEKLVGSWDYSLSRHAQTPLTDDEMAYAQGDCYTLLAWLKYWMGLNPEIDKGLLGLRILTKTSVVRTKCRAIAEAVKIPTRKGKYTSVFYEYVKVCKSQLPPTEADYKLMIRSTSAGWTFTATRGAGRAWDNVYKYDATSMHPSHMVSHYYPQFFEILEDKEKARFVFSTVCGKPVENVLANWVRPFEYAFNARVRFTNVRMRTGSVFARDGVGLHSQAIFSNYECRFDDLDDESSNREFNAINDSGYRNMILSPLYEFSKVVECDEMIVSLNEINAWVMAQVYEWDSFEVLEMSASADFKRVPEYVNLSVATMLERKSYVKKLMRGYDLPRPDWIPESAYNALKNNPDGEEAKAFYMLVKSDLNSLYGMFATNEFKQRIEYDGDWNTFDYDGPAGFENAPKTPKAWYQFGMRIAAFSRLQQCIALMLLYDAGIIKCMVNGDTDSFAFQAAKGKTHDDVSKALEPLHNAINRSIGFVNGDSAETFLGLGLYEVDCKPDLYCAVANKRYAYTTEGGTHIHVASAGVPIASVEAALRFEMSRDDDFSRCVIKTLGYEVEYVGALSGTKARVIPEWGEVLAHDELCEDHLGNLYVYPRGTCVGIALTDTSKILGAGYELDYMRTCANANLPLMGPRHYELVPTDTITPDGKNETILGVW